METKISRRYRDTTAANRKRRITKQRRWAEEMRSDGWTVIEPEGKGSGLQNDRPVPGNRDDGGSGER